MNQRERILLFVVVGILVSWVGVQAVKTLYIEKLASLDRQIKAKQDRLAKFQLEKAQLRGRLSDWENRMVETLSLDPVDARMKMVNELSALANRHGLGNNAVRPLVEAVDKKTGIVSLQFNVEGVAPLNAIVSFLYDLHSLPFLVRTETVRLVPKGGKDKGKIQLTVKGETIVLPTQLALKGGKTWIEVHRLAPVTRTADLDPQKRRAVVRTEHPDVADYLVLADKKIFEPYTPPPPAPVQHVEAPKPATQPVAVTQAPTTPSPPPRDPARASTKIAALIGTPDDQQVIVTGGDQKRRPFSVGDAFDGGKLISVHPEGAVAVYDNKPWFYPVGKTMAEAVILTADVSPRVYALFHSPSASTTQPATP